MNRTLGIDIDGCVDESPFFSILTHLWVGDVIVITYRRDRDKAISDLKKHNIHFTDVILAKTFDDKARIIAEKNVSFYIDDQPEMLKHVSQDVAVMLFRNEGNFDFGDRKWIFSDKTGKLC